MTSHCLKTKLKIILMTADHIYTMIKNCKSATATCSPAKMKTIESVYPASVSIDALLKAGKLAKPQPRNKVTFTLEAFDIESREVDRSHGRRAFC